MPEAEDDVRVAATCRTIGVRAPVPSPERRRFNEVVAGVTVS